MSYRTTLRGRSHAFGGLRELLAKASPHRSGDALAGLAAESYAERVAAQTVLADVPLTAFLEDLVTLYESDDVTRLIVDTHDAAAFAPIRHLTVGGLRDHLLCCDPSDLTPGLTPEMVAAVSKLMRNQDLVAVARRCQVTSAFRTTVGLPGRMSTRLQPNHPTDDPAGVLAATVDGLLHGCGDAVIGINPATDAPAAAARLLHLLDDLRQRLEIPTQSCVLSHVTTTIGLIERGAPFDLVFQSIAGTQAANEAFGITLDMLGEAREAAVALKRGNRRARRDVLRDRPRKRAFRGRPPRGGPADRRGAGLRRRARVLAVPGQHGRGVHRARIPLRRWVSRAAPSSSPCRGPTTSCWGTRACPSTTPTTSATYWGSGRRPSSRRGSTGSACSTRVVTCSTPRRPLPRPRARDRRTAMTSSLDPWPALRSLMPARIGLGRSGHALPTAAVLAFAADHAAARDAVHDELDTELLTGQLGGQALVVASAAPDRATYLQRPDLGRTLSTSSRAALTPSHHDVVFVLADGLSARAVHEHAVAVMAATVDQLRGNTVGPAVLARQARVALGDEVAVLVGASLVVMLIGERPGLSSANSLSAYTTYAPRLRVPDSRRSCISNIRPDAGLSVAAASAQLAHLIRASLEQQTSGIGLRLEPPSAINP